LADAPLLSVRGLVKSFGGVRALDGASFDVDRGSITALIGPNGAGKTTAVNVIAGALRPDAGSVHFDGTDVTRLKSWQLARSGLIRTFQISREFAGMTVLENLVVVVPGQAGERFVNAAFRPSVGRAGDHANVERALTVLSTFSLFPLRDEYAGNLSGGQKRLLELARSVMAEPKLCVLDEPLAGVNPALVERITGHLGDLRELGITFLMVEHNLHAVERVCDHVVVMAEGRMLAQGGMAELRANAEVVRAYLGAAQA
jgi:ABC-type branched-subunit amino acid transport system ATPase component